MPADKLSELRVAAGDYVFRATGCPLDGSEESLAFVDHYLDRLHQDPPSRPEVLRIVAFALGVYLGELAITRFGGRWVALKAEAPAIGQPADETAQDPSLAPLRWRVDLDAAPLRVDPIGMVAAAVARTAATPGNSDGEDAEAEPDVEGIVLRPGARHLQKPLLDLLSQMAPVSADYYYSLTGRFETLVHIVELVVELGQARAQPVDEEDDRDASPPRLLH